MAGSKISYSTSELSDDCGQVVIGGKTEAQEVESGELLAKLQAFAAIPAVDLVDAAPTISLMGKGSEFLVRNEGGQLFLVEAPTATNSPVQKSPAEIVQFLSLIHI